MFQYRAFQIVAADAVLTFNPAAADQRALSPSLAHRCLPDGWGGCANSRVLTHASIVAGAEADHGAVQSIV